MQKLGPQLKKSLKHKNQVALFALQHKVKSGNEYAEALRG
jgi:hypothetical protein